MLELVSELQLLVLYLILLIDQTGVHIYEYFGVVCFFKFATYWFTVCIAGDMFTGDDIQFSADIHIICADTILTLVNKDGGVGLHILTKTISFINEILYV